IRRPIAGLTLRLLSGSHPSSHVAVVTLLRPVERALDCVNHSQVELDARRSVAACINKNTGGADVETRICQPLTHGWGKIIELMYIQTEPSSNVVHRACLPSSTAIRLEPQIGLSLIDDTPASEKIVMRLAHLLITGKPANSWLTRLLAAARK